MSKKKEQKEQQEESLEVKRSFKAKNEAQQSYIDKIANNDITLCIGPSGTGKTACAVYAAIKQLQENKVNRIIVTRPTVEAGRGLGFLPGGIDEKYGPYMIPIFEELKKFLGKDVLEKLILENVIMFMPLEYIRGMTFTGSFVLLDEAQNCTLEQLKMFMTRIGSYSTMVIDGDIEQNDLRQDYCDWEDVFKGFNRIEGIATHEFTDDDIVRSPIIRRIIERFVNIEAGIRE